MSDIAFFQSVVNGLDDVGTEPHFEVISFRYKKKIFATLNTAANRACVRLSEIDQSAFCAYRKDVMYPVPNKWGKLGWTNINLDNIPDEMLKDAIETAYLHLKSGKKKA